MNMVKEADMFLGSFTPNVFFHRFVNIWKKVVTKQRCSPGFGTSWVSWESNIAMIRISYWIKYGYIPTVSAVRKHLFQSNSCLQNCHASNWKEKKDKKQKAPRTPYLGNLTGANKEKLKRVRIRFVFLMELIKFANVFINKSERIWGKKSNGENEKLPDCFWNWKNLGSGKEEHMWEEVKLINVSVPWYLKKLCTTARERRCFLQSWFVIVFPMQKLRYFFPLYHIDSLTPHWQP